MDNSTQNGLYQKMIPFHEMKKNHGGKLLDGGKHLVFPPSEKLEGKLNVDKRRRKVVKHHISLTFQEILK